MQQQYAMNEYQRFVNAAAGRDDGQRNVCALECSSVLALPPSQLHGKVPAEDLVQAITSSRTSWGGVVHAGERPQPPDGYVWLQIDGGANLSILKLGQQGTSSADRDAARLCPLSFR